jgi:hypothetical protein
MVKKLLMVSLLSLAAITASGLPSNASLIKPTCTGPKAKISYYDCNTGVWCGDTDIYCDADPVHVGCQTACYRAIRADCICPPPPI